VPRTPVSAGNLKMNTTLAEFDALARALRASCEAISGVETVVCPPFPYLVHAAEVLRDSGIAVGAQNVYWEDKGAFTGEVSALMLAGIVEYVIVGHSERRALFGDTDETVRNRVTAALRAGLHPILCVGETLDQRKAGATGEVLERQVGVALHGLSLPPGFVIAYEPVWAIGTGRAATGAIANEAIGFIRSHLATVAGAEAAQTARILYGGSVTATNIAEFMREPEIDGALVGGASLRADEFTTITRTIAELRGFDGPAALQDRRSDAR